MALWIFLKIIFDIPKMLIQYKNIFWGNPEEKRKRR